MNFFFTYWRHL
jgi:hypothetical protein